MSPLIRQRGTVLILTVLFISLVYSKFMLTVCMLALILLSLWPNSKTPFTKHLKQIWSSYRSYLPYPALGLLFFIVLYTGLYSSDTEYWLERLRIKLPFLVLPIAFAGLPKLEKKQWRSLYYLLLWIITLSCIGVGINYYINYEEIMIAIGQGRAVPTPTNHIRFSLLMVIAILGGWRLWQTGYWWKKPWEKHIILAMTLFLFCFIHLLAVRSGLASLYLAILVGGFKWLWESGKKLWIPVVLAVFTMLPIIAYQFIPSFQTKVNYTLWDWKMYQQGEGSHYSDAGRWISLELAIKLFKESPILGVGYGDLKMEMEQKYQQHYPQIKETKRPHNQFITVLAATGLLGMFFFLFALGTTFFYQKNFQDTFFLILFTILMASFMVENTIENAVGVALFLIFLLIELKKQSTH